MTLEEIENQIREYKLIIQNKRPGYNLKNCEQIIQEYEKRKLLIN